VAQSTGSGAALLRLVRGGLFCWNLQRCTEFTKTALCCWKNPLKAVSYHLFFKTTFNVMKYDPLMQLLSSLPKRENSKLLTFKHIEKEIGDKLPNSARSYPAWWANQSSFENRPQARAWTEAGFKVHLVALDKEQVTFTRV
jgi:hypothetical protein